MFRNEEEEKCIFLPLSKSLRKARARAEGGELETTSLLRVQIEGECIAVKAKLLQLRHLCFCKFSYRIFLQ